LSWSFYLAIGQLRGQPRKSHKKKNPYKLLIALRQQVARMEASRLLTNANIQDRTNQLREYTGKTINITRKFTKHYSLSSPYGSLSLSESKH
jgi:hypothetical protein